MKCSINKKATLCLILNDFHPNQDDIDRFIKKNKKLSFEGLKFFPISKFYFQSHKRKSYQYYFIFKKINKIRRTYAQWKGTEIPKGSFKYLIRVDDFPHWEKNYKEFLRFAELFSKYNIPFLLGVTPFLSLNPKSIYNTKFKFLDDNEVKILKEFSNIEISLHGLTHQSVNKKRTTEFIGLTDGEVEEKLTLGIKLLEEKQIFPIAFIPPFDKIDKNNFEIIKKHFKIICGGFDTAKYVGYLITPCIVDNKTAFVPSYFPLSGNINEIHNFLLDMKEENIIVPITIHWTCEVNNLERVENFLKFIEKKVISWRNFLSIIENL